VKSSWLCIVFLFEVMCYSVLDPGTRFLFSLEMVWRAGNCFRWTRVEKHTLMYTYFPNLFFVVLYTSLALMLIYYRYIAIDWWFIYLFGKDMEGNVPCIKVLHKHFLGVTEEYYEEPRSGKLAFGLRMKLRGSQIQSRSTNYSPLILGL
jgi:hypothetical protein